MGSKFNSIMFYLYLIVICVVCYTDVSDEQCIELFYKL